MCLDLFLEVGHKHHRARLHDDIYPKWRSPASPTAAESRAHTFPGHEEMPEYTGGLTDPNIGRLTVYHVSRRRNREDSTQGAAKLDRG